MEEEKVEETTPEAVESTETAVEAETVESTEEAVETPVE